MRFRRVRNGDAAKLVDFYNHLSPASIRTFRPLGERAMLETIENIIRDNRPWANKKYDLVIEDDSTIVGWSFIWDLQGPEPLFGLAVADSYHHCGLGKRLISKVMAWAHTHRIPKVYLTVVQDNVNAWRLYEKYGFERYGEIVGDDGLPYFKMAAQYPYLVR